MFFPICHPERSEGSRDHKVSATEIFRRFAPLNDIMIKISSYLLYGGAAEAISLLFLNYLKDKVLCFSGRERNTRSAAQNK